MRARAPVGARTLRSAAVTRAASGGRCLTTGGVGVGVGVVVGGVDGMGTTAVGSEVAGAPEPPALDAVSMTRIVSPASPAATV